MSTPEKMLSFVVPIYNPDLVLFDKVLKAITTQSLKNWEAILVLDGPNPDAERAIERAFKKVPQHYKIIELEHGGAQKARNAGFKHTKGDYIVHFDSDCVIEPHAAKMWVDTFEKEPSVGFIYSGYRFLGEKGAIASEPFDPWTLRVRNYISACFPVRREFVSTWDESLESLQDWSFWLSAVEKGAVGKFIPGFAFSTAFPTPKSISGQGCTAENWLGRMDKVKALHNIPIREVCVTSLHNRLDGISIAKAINADYDDAPNHKPNHYKTIIQVGFSVAPGEFERCASAWGKEHKKIIFWSADDVEAIYRGCSVAAVEQYAKRLNLVASQFVEDKAAQEIMRKAGFSVEVLPLPVISKEEVAPLPEEPSFLVDVSPDYGHVFQALQASIPDIALEQVGGTKEIEKYTGFICFHKDRLMRQGIKRMLAAGRTVVSNVQQPFAGYLNDNVSNGVFIKTFVGKIRAAAKAAQSREAVRYWTDRRRVDRFLEAVS